MTRASLPDGINRQRYLEEIIKKEVDSRIWWYYKSKEKEREGVEPIKSRQYEVFRKKLERQSLQPSEEQLRIREKRLRVRSTPVDKDRGIEDRDGGKELRKEITLPPLQMKPADAGTREMLYEGLSKDGRGRFSYLRARNALVPDQKYSFPVVTSWDYGWKLDDVIKKEDFKNPAHGRTRVIHETFYSRNGILAASNSTG